MAQRSMKSGVAVGVATFMPLTLFFVYLQFAWASYQSLGSVGAAIVAPLWLAVTSPIWILIGQGDMLALFGLFLKALLFAMAYATLGSSIIAWAVQRAANSRS